MMSGGNPLPFDARAREIRIPLAGIQLNADVAMPTDARGVVIFAHGSGSGRHSPRNRYVAEVLQQHGLATVLADLLTDDEEHVDQSTRHYRFDIPLLARRLAGITQWVSRQLELEQLDCGYFGASTGAAAALIAAAGSPQIRAVVSRGGRPDLAGEALPRVTAPVLLLVGGHDYEVLKLNEKALQSLHAESRLEVIPHASHLFEEAGSLETVAQQAAEWFARHLGNR